MKRLLLCCVLLCLTQASMALSPYVYGDKLPPADMATQLSQIEKKLQAVGFTVIGRHTPKGLPGHGSVIVTDRAILDSLRAIGGSAIIAAGIRVGVQTDGTVSYMNPDYWYRAYLRGKFEAAQPSVTSVQAKMAQALGQGATFGGDVADDALPNYRYMFGMERFDSGNSELSTHGSYEDAVKTVQENLARSVAETSKVYEVAMPDRKIAVFGVAMNSEGSGEGWWVNKIGADHVAALPYEIFIVGNKVYALYARYRIALAWPALGMGQFMGIINAPHVIQETMSRVATAP